MPETLSEKPNILFIIQMRARLTEHIERADDKLAARRLLYVLKRAQ